MRRVVVLAFIWGWSFVLIEVALRAMSPAALAFGRVASAAVVLLAVLHARGERLPKDRNSWRHFLVMGLLSSAIPFTSLAWGQERITSALTSVVNATTPLFAAAIVAATTADRLRRGQFVGLLIALAGVGLAAGIGGDDVAGSSLTGVLAVVLASSCYGAAFAYADRNMRGMSPLTASSGQLVMASVLTIPGAVITSLDSGLAFTPGRVAAIVTLGVIGTGVAYLLNYRNIADLGPTRASVVTYLIPVVAVTVGVVVLGEPFSPRILIGGALVVAGLLLVQERLGRRHVAAVTAVATVIVGGCGGGDDGASSDPGGCDAARMEALDPRSSIHLLPNAPSPKYNSIPPTSGSHRGIPVEGGLRTAPLDGPDQVTLLEGGTVLVQYEGVGADDAERLGGLVSETIAVAPGRDLPSPVVATAWTWKLECDGVDLEAIRRFAVERGGQGPGTPEDPAAGAADPPTSDAG